MSEKRKEVKMSKQVVAFDVIEGMPSARKQARMKKLLAETV